MPVHWKNFFLPGTVFSQDREIQQYQTFDFKLFFFHVHHPAFPQIHLNLQHNLAMTWLSYHWCPFDADCANHVFFFSKIEEKYGFYALISPPLCWEDVLGILNCSVKQGSESNCFSHMLGTSLLF